MLLVAATADCFVDMLGLGVVVATGFKDGLGVVATVGTGDGLGLYVTIALGAADWLGATVIVLSQPAVRMIINARSIANFGFMLFTACLILVASHIFTLMFIITTNTLFFNIILVKLKQKIAPTI